MPDKYEHLPTEPVKTNRDSKYDRYTWGLLLNNYRIKRSKLYPDEWFWDTSHWYSGAIDITTGKSIPVPFETYYNY